MYTPQEVEEALEQHDWLLSDALYKMERFAQVQGLTTLAEWCNKEANGYYGDSLATSEVKQKTPYRIIPVQWIDINSRPVVLSPDAVSYNTMPILNGVLEIESYADKGMAMNWPELADVFSDQIRGAKLHPEHLKALLRGVRHQARRNLHDNIPHIPGRALLYANPNFGNLVHDADLARILAQRWIEANLAFGAGAYLATMILLGSILEGTLLDKTERNPKQANQATSSPKKDGKVLAFRDWSLDSLIQVAHECDWIKKDMKDFSVVVRNYRNFVHPNQEREQGITPNAGTCRVVWEVVTAALQ